MVGGHRTQCFQRHWVWRENPASTGKTTPHIAVSITEDALKGFSNDFLSIIWIFKSQYPYSNSSGSKMFQQKATHNRSDGKGKGKIIEEILSREEKIRDSNLYEHRQITSLKEGDSSLYAYTNYFLPSAAPSSPSPLLI